MRPLRAVALLGLGAASLAGCGGAAGGDAVGTGTTPGPSRPAPSAAVHAQQVAVHERVLAALRDTAGDDARAGIPAYLPRTTAPAGRLVTATPTRHVLAVQGDAVALRLAGGASARATVVGPDVPDQFHGTDAKDVPASFVLTVSAVHGSVPLGVARWTVTDEGGVVHHPRVTVAGGGALPTRAPAGTTTTLRLRTRLPIGNGRVRYAPTGRATLAAWDFDNESD